MSKRKKLFAAMMVSLCVLGFWALPASAAQYEFMLFVEGDPVYFYLNQVGPNVYSVNAVYPTVDKSIPMSGTCVVEGPNARFGLTLHNALLDYAPVVWEFIIDIGTMSGSGGYRWLVETEDYGTFTIGPTTVADGLSDLTHLGAR